MSYQIRELRFHLRETAPARFAFALGKKGTAESVQPTTSPLCHVELRLRESQGGETFGTAADRLSVRWLDKRPGREKARKLRELAGLIEHAGRIYRDHAEFETPFELWRACHGKIMEVGRRAGQEDLTSTFASALLERAVIDGVCRLAARPFHRMLRDDRLGFRPGQVFAELKDLDFTRLVPYRPRRLIRIRHTIGPYDPLTAEDWPEEQRLGDGLPETVEEYIRRDGILYFKVKVTGDAQRDLKRLARIWELLPHESEPVVTLDANEAFDDLERLAAFVKRLEDEQLGLFQHIAYIEQPLKRGLALDPQAGKWIRRISEHKRLIIDESDATVDAFRRAASLGYAGTSHKNCKGVFKSLLNRALVYHYAEEGRETLLSAEDLQNLPIVPLHQDFVSVAVLDLEHCERNGHHYNYGLSMLSEKDKASVARHHRDLYVERDGEWFMNVRSGRVDIGSLLAAPAFGVFDEPDWASMEPLGEWLERRYPA